MQQFWKRIFSFRRNDQDQHIDPMPFGNYNSLMQICSKSKRDVSDIIQLWFNSQVNNLASLLSSSVLFAELRQAYINIYINKQLFKKTLKGQNRHVFATSDRFFISEPEKTHLRLVGIFGAFTEISWCSSPWKAMRGPAKSFWSWQQKYRNSNGIKTVVRSVEKALPLQ